MLRTVQLSAGAEYPTLFSGGLKPDPIVYGLVDPRCSQVVRYVGQTMYPESRYRAHCEVKGWGSRPRRIAWTRALLAENILPSMVLLERVDECDLLTAERRWISKLTEEGQADLNGLDPEDAKRAWEERRRDTAQNRTAVESLIRKIEMDMFGIASNTP